MKSSAAGGAATATTQPRKTGIAFILRALQSRNYRLFFSGQSISLIGSWMTRIATSWLIYRLTHSALLLGVVGFASQLPTFLLAPFAGVWVDRLNRHRLLVITQILAMLQSFALAALAIAGIITIWEVLLLGAAQGLINAFDMPARQAFVVEMVENKEDLGNAIALNSSMVNAARLLGPSIGGVIIAAVGEGWCFFIDGVSYLAVIASLLMMRVTPRESRAHKTAAWQQLREGWRYAAGFTPIRLILTMLATISLLAMPYMVLMPVFAAEMLHGKSSTLGLLMAASGTGALGGALFLAARKSVLGLGRLIPLAATIFGIGLISFSFSHTLWISLPLMMVTGFGSMVHMASSNTLLQTIVDDDKRGRVMSFYTMAFMGTAPFGSLLAGTLCTRIGAPHTLILSGLCCLAGAVWFSSNLPALRAAIRPIYIGMGIIPEVATGIQNATELTRPPED